MNEGKDKLGDIHTDNSVLIEQTTSTVHPDMPQCLAKGRWTRETVRGKQTRKLDKMSHKM